MREQDWGEASTLPVWLVTLFVIGFAIAFVWAWAATYYNNEKFHRLEKHDKAWDYLAKIAPVLRDWDTFGVQDRYYDYETKRYQDAEPREIDIDRVIEAGTLYDERSHDRKVSSRLTELDTLLAATRPEPVQQKDKDQTSE